MLQRPATRGATRQLRLQPSTLTLTNTKQPHRCKGLSVDGRPLVPCITAHCLGPEG